MISPKEFTMTDHDQPTTPANHVHIDQHRAAVRAAHAAELAEAIKWLPVGDAFISKAGELVVRVAGTGSAELREELDADHLEPGVFRQQLIRLAKRLRTQPSTYSGIPGLDAPTVTLGATVRPPAQPYDGPAALPGMPCVLAAMHATRIARLSNDPRVEAVIALAESYENRDDRFWFGPADGTLRDIIFPGDVGSWSAKDREQFLIAFLGLMSTRDLDEIAQRAQAELNRPSDSDDDEQATESRELF